jgi:hypothetical protein
MCLGRPPAHLAQSRTPEPQSCEWRNGSPRDQPYIVDPIVNNL